ncbi:MAG: hypothetical protein LBD30_04890, partial [Verrucomicrobiales bacterium]|nr:hypothetical protein [Verrucomicrobiales bacterium]
MSKVTNSGVKVLFPGKDRWELRVFNGRDNRVLETAEEPLTLAAQLNAHSQVALPVSQVTVFPLWLTTEDGALLAGMLELQLEKRGLLAASRGETVSDYRVLRREDGRTLVSVSVLSRDFPESWCIGKVRRYVSAADYVDRTAGQISLWRELGQLAVTFSVNGEWVYALTLHGRITGAELAGEIRRALLQLEAAQINLQPAGLLAWDEHDRAMLEQTARELRLPLTVTDHMPLSLPLADRNLVPVKARQEQQRQARRQRNRRILRGAGLLYLLGVLMVSGWLGRLWWERHELEKKLAAHREEVSIIRTTALRWQSLEPAILPETYPLEVMFRCARLLPEEGVRL